MNGDISRPQQGPQGRIKADRLWQELVELLNSLGGGVSKPMEKWKKAPQSERISPPPVTDSTQNVGPSISSTNYTEIEYIGSHFTQDTTSTAPPALSPLPPVVTPPPGPSSAPMPTTTATSPIATTSRGAQQRRRNRANASPAASSSTLSTPRRRGLRRARTRRIQTPFERSTSEFVAVETRRLRLEENRDKMQNEREVDRLRLESRRLDLQERQDQSLNDLARAVDSLVQILPQLRPSSLPSTDIIP